MRDRTFGAGSGCGGPAPDRFMARALELAGARLGSVSPKPAVGAVLVKGDRIVAAAGTEPGSGRHAERAAIDTAGGDARGCDLFVTLEPCTHYGNTPPCSRLVIDAGIARVFAAVADPNPESGDGFGELAQAGIEVEVGISATEAVEIYQGFFKWIETRRPYVTAKWAMSLDGKIATRSGDSRYISGEQSRQAVHTMRKETDAILVGVGTALVDDPLLTCRLPSVGAEFQPLRVVLDSSARTPPNAGMLAASTPGKTLIAVSERAPADRVEHLRHTGAEVAILPGGNGISLSDLLDELGRRGILNLLVEGGGTVLGSFFDAGLVDRVETFVAPKVLGGAAAPGPVAGEGLASLAEAGEFQSVDISQSGTDSHIAAVIRTYGPGAG
ncbi:MAG: bifunctional diaminohydroxyphosphoribosylaminopyrimidine deaminase/5-amino-6-(5-phosphoribosylamino)uracil reductase RibD [Chloroflexi bacterium]|nr:bifunctional diaminohydroxyphosphoribosylaminopyrimidine deaminase/5-amino-6-(5-phosphoribosylamino)uracil reductase RibD [Chloroflexota bacterium]MCY3939352.1 bifunctional diaminohydroxyphosphoribosylaminopyrimidine deaminase/5-amino-6-(5-phosphoribosylamino)uracil reductase RibD [Chloroflexota bacterium]